MYVFLAAFFGDNSYWQHIKEEYVIESNLRYGILCVFDSTKIVFLFSSSWPLFDLAESGPRGLVVHLMEIASWLEQAKPSWIVHDIPGFNYNEETHQANTAWLSYSKRRFLISPYHRNSQTYHQKIRFSFMAGSTKLMPTSLDSDQNHWLLLEIFYCQRIKFSFFSKFSFFFSVTLEPLFLSYNNCCI